MNSKVSNMIETLCYDIDFNACIELKDELSANDVMNYMIYIADKSLRKRYDIKNVNTNADAKKLHEKVKNFSDVLISDKNLNRKL